MTKSTTPAAGSPLVLAAVLASTLLAAPAAASPCADRIAALEARLDEAAETSISTSSGGQGVAGAREGQAQQGGNAAAPAGQAAVPYQDERQEARVVDQAKAAGDGGDRVMQAKATLSRARTADQRGDGAACADAVAEAEGKLEAN
jgi:hypothetical protein